jgi:hypothetical protein
MRFPKAAGYKAKWPDAIPANREGNRYAPKKQQVETILVLAGAGKNIKTVAEGHDRLIMEAYSNRLLDVII